MSYSYIFLEYRLKSHLNFSNLLFFNSSRNFSASLEEHKTHMRTCCVETDYSFFDDDAKMALICGPLRAALAVKNVAGNMPPTLYRMFSLSAA